MKKNCIGIILKPLNRGSSEIFINQNEELKSKSV